MTGGRWVAGACLFLIPSLAAGQSGAVRLGLVNQRAERVAPNAVAQQLTGWGWGLDAAFGWGPATLALQYAEGGVSDGVDTTSTDLVDGEAVLWVAPIRYAAVGVGRHLRSYVRAGGTERWRTWELRAQGSATLLDGLVGGYLNLWLVLGGSADVLEELDGGRGLEGGLRLAVGRLPVSARLRYRVERLNLGAGTRQETVEQIGIAVGIGRR